MWNITENKAPMDGEIAGKWYGRIPDPSEGKGWRIGGDMDKTGVLRLLQGVGPQGPDRRLGYSGTSLLFVLKHHPPAQLPPLNCIVVCMLLNCIWIVVVFG